ncbi:MAG: 30S ribosomal protein S6 [Candidatus Shikimatogenerans bostrichidophilus]|nr:MAG: 30S ribosomal protein S6 [Candidatus Shikimatogenerans bostrichidophilus]
MYKEENIIRHYETIIVFTPVLSEDQIKNSYNEYKNYLIKKNVEIIKKEKWGMKKLLYKIKNKKNGFFYLFEYKTNVNFIKKFNLKMINDERIIRFLIIKMNKYAIEYSKTRTIKKNEKK